MHKEGNDGAPVCRSRKRRVSAESSSLNRKGKGALSLSCGSNSTKVAGKRRRRKMVKSSTQSQSMCDVWLIELVIRLIELLWQLIQDKIAAGKSRRITFTKTEWQCLADEICKHDLAPLSEDKKITGAKVAEKVTRMKSSCKYFDEIQVNHSDIWDKWVSVLKHIENRSMSSGVSSSSRGGDRYSSASQSFNLTETDLIMRVQEIFCDLKEDSLIDEKIYDGFTDMAYLIKDPKWFGQLVAMKKREDQIRYLMRWYKEFKKNQKAKPKPLLAGW